MHSIHQQLSVTSWHSAMQLLSVQGETTNSVPSLLFLVVTAFPSSQGHLFNWFCKPLATKFTTASARWLPKLPQQFLWPLLIGHPPPHGFYSNRMPISGGCPKSAANLCRSMALASALFLSVATLNHW